MNKIKEIELIGFKAFVGDNLELGDLTLLTGLNSSGKSSVIQALLMLGKIANNESFLLDGHGDFAELQNPYSEELELTAFLESGDRYSLKRHKQESKVSIGFAFPEIIYISADRFGPETNLPITNDSKLGKRGENILKCIAENEHKEIPALLKHENSEGETFEYNLKAWLGVVSPNVKFEFKIQSLSDTSFTTFNKHRSKNVGFGLSYTLPVITALLLGSITENSLVIIENPEAHLHPRGQTEIARLIALCVEAGTQVIIETHSDHLFDGIRIHAKKSETNFHEKVRTYWFELDKNRNTDVQEVSLDKNGRISDAPQGLFDQFEINASKLF